MKVNPPHARNFNKFYHVNNDSDSFTHGFKVLYSNVDSLLNKRNELKCIIKDEDYDILLFTEILPKNCKNVCSSELSIDNYVLFTSSLNTGRGVAIYINEKWKASTDDSLMAEEPESVWCKIRLRGSDNLLVGNVYRSPNSTSENNSKLNELLLKAVNTNNTHVLITGDFNFKDINWNMKQCDINDETQSAFIETINDCYLYQHVKEDKPGKRTKKKVV